MKTKKTCSISFTGDISFDRYMNEMYNDENILDSNLLQFLHDSDHVLINVEGALSNSKDNGSHGIFFHCMNPDAIKVFNTMHADIWNIGNNHTMDAGVDGLKSTLEYAKMNHVQTIGAGLNEKQASTPIYLNEAGGIGIFGVSYMKECIPATNKDAGVFRWNNFELIQERINEIKKKCRWCIIVSHGGEEFADMPNPYTRNRYLKYLEMGCDIVVAHHPHVVENYELFNKKAIFYSLGNFIFDTDYQRVHPYTENGVILKLNFNENDFSIVSCGTLINRNNHHIEQSNVPDIFTNINQNEYELLAPLSSLAFIVEEKKKMIYLDKDKYLHANEEVWNQYFYSDCPDGYDKDNHMDFSVVIPYSKKAYDNEWKKSSLEKVKQYLLNHFENKHI